MRVLITAIGSFSADRVIKNLKETGNYVVGCDINDKELLANANMVDAFYKAPFAIDEKKYLEFIASVCKKEKVEFIFPLTDVEIDLLNAKRSYFEKNKITIYISSFNTIKICREKKKLFDKLFGVKGIKLITTEYANSYNHQFGYPLVAKPIDGRSSQGLHYIHNNEEWKLFCKECDVNKYIIQPFIKGSIVVADVVRQNINGEIKIVSMVRKELLRTHNGAGLSVHVFTDEMLQKMVETIADKLDIIGCVCFEFIEDEQGNYCFMECNPRFSGGIAFSCIAGYDFVNNHLNVFCNKKIDDLTEVKSMYIAKKYQEFITKID